jgi:CBS domain-containing protein
MDVASIMIKKLVALGPKDPLSKAAQLMREEEVGCVLVLDERRKPLGILTDRDLVVRGVATGRSLSTPVEEVMSRNPFTTKPTEPVMLAARRMADLLVRRLPVVDEEGRAVGLISVDDLLTILITELSNVASAIVGTSKLVR